MLHISAFIIPIQIGLPVHPFCWDCILSSYAKLLSTSTFMRFQHRRYSSKARKAACTVATSAAFSVGFKRRWRILSNASEKIITWLNRQMAKKMCWLLKISCGIFLQTNIATGIPHLEIVHSRASLPKYYLIGECETQSFQITKNIPTLHEIFGHTPPKTNMEPENEALEEEISIKNHHFQVPC